MAARQDRLVENQRTFRAANERLSALARDAAADGRLIPFLCECADDRCLGRVPLTLSEYDEIRNGRDLYVMLRHHKLAEGESIVERRNGLDIARKSDGA